MGHTSPMHLLTAEKAVLGTYQARWDHRVHGMWLCPETWVWDHCRSSFCVPPGIREDQTHGNDGESVLSPGLFLCSELHRGGWCQGSASSSLDGGG